MPSGRRVSTMLAAREVTMHLQDAENIQFDNQGLAVQSVVSLMSSLRGQLIKCFRTL